MSHSPSFRGYRVRIMYGRNVPAQREAHLLSEWAATPNRSCLVHTMPLSNANVEVLPRSRHDIVAHRAYPGDSP